MRAASGEQLAVAAEEAGGDIRGEAAGGGQPWKKYVYVEPSRRVKEILEEELCFQKEACHVKHPAAGLRPMSKLNQNEFKTVGFTDRNVQKLGDVISFLSDVKTI